MTSGRGLVRNYYAKLGAAGLRNRTRPHWDSAITDEVIAYLGPRKRVLDVGCGYGRIALLLAARGYHVTGIDISEPLLHSVCETAVEQAIRLPVALADMTRLPFRTTSFDALICLWSAYFEVVDVTDQVRALSEMSRVLVHDGLAVIEGPAPPAIDDEVPVNRISHGTVEGIPVQGYIHDFDTLRERCAQAGIAKCEVRVRDWASRDRTVLTFQR